MSKTEISQRKAVLYDIEHCFAYRLVNTSSLAGIPQENQLKSKSLCGYGRGG